MKLKADAEVKLQTHNYLGENKNSGVGPGKVIQESGKSDGKKTILDRKIHMSSIESRAASESQDNKKKVSVILTANSVFGLREPRCKKNSPMEPHNRGQETGSEGPLADCVEHKEGDQSKFFGKKGENFDVKSEGERGRKENQKDKFVNEQQKVQKDAKLNFSNVSGPDIKRKTYEYGFKDTVTFTRTGKGEETPWQNPETGLRQQKPGGDEKDTLKTRKKDEKISSKNDSVRGRTKKKAENTRMKKAIRRRKLAFMVSKLSGEDQKDSLAKTVKDIAVMRAGLVVKQFILYLLGLLGPLLGGLVTIALPFLILIVILYNTPLALFLPPLQEGETVQSVLSGYYREFNEEIREAEEDSDEEAAYKNMENGAARSNFMDVMMVYMVRYGTGQGNFSTVMSVKNKERLKEIFDEMNHFESETVTDTVRVGESLGVMTLSGAVDAYNPTLPMGTHIIAGGKEYVVEDTGDFDRYGVDFDMYFEDHQTVQNFGHQNMEVYLADSNGSNTVEVTHTSLYVYNLSYEDYIDLGRLTSSQAELLRKVMSDEFLQSMPASGIGEQVALAALDKVGCQYSQDLRYEEGYYDCSSLVQRLYAEFGINLPSVASTQGQYIVENGLQISENELRPGDLIFHSRESNADEFMSIGHVAIYVGNGMQVDARGTAYGVVYRPLVPSNIGLYGRPCP